MVTSVDVARKVGLSQSTVSRVFRGDPSVHPATKEKVLDAARALGYVPNRAARALVTRRSQTVGVVVADLANPFYPRIIAAMQSELAQRGYRMALIRDPGETGGRSDVDVLQEAAVDGAVFLSAAKGSTAVRRFAQSGSPVVQMSRYDPDFPSDLVLPDDVRGAELLAEHLAALGHERIGLLTGPGETTSSMDRERSFREALGRRGMTLADGYLRRGSITHASGVAMARSLLQEDLPPTAIYGASDTLAIGALDAAAQLGIRVPEGLSVVGFDDSEPSGWSMINLTTVHQPLEEMARASVTLLLERLDGERTDEPARRIFPVELVVRGTTAPPHG
jgi:LacI family transcriptional regulator